MIEPLTEPAPANEHATDPILPAVKVVSPELCGICGKPAEPRIYCHLCHTPLCMKHIEMVMASRGVATACPEHKGGE